MPPPPRTADRTAAKPRPDEPSGAPPRPSRGGATGRPEGPRAPRARVSSVASASVRTTAAPLDSSARAFASWWACVAAANGTRSAGRPAAAISAIVIAPARATTRSAAAYAAAMSSRNSWTNDAVGRKAEPRVRRHDLAGVVLSRLMHDVESDPRRGDARERGRHEPIQDLRALAAADDENPQAPMPLSRDEGRDLEEVLSNRIARHDRSGQRRGAARGADRDALRHAREQAVREAGNRVLLVNQRRHAARPRRGHERARGVAPDAHDGARGVPREKAQRIDERERQREESLEARAPALAHEALRADELEGKAGLRHERRLEPARGAHEHDGRARPPPPDLAGQRERREDVPARPSARDEKAALAS